MIPLFLAEDEENYSCQRVFRDLNKSPRPVVLTVFCDFSHFGASSYCIPHPNIKL